MMNLPTGIRLKAGYNRFDGRITMPSAGGRFTNRAIEDWRMSCAPISRHRRRLRSMR
jgi:hypothetical protein